MTENKRFTAWGNRIKRNGTLLNIEFKTKVDAKLGCKLCNQMDKETQEFVDKVNELNKWHKDHYGKTILDERLEFKSPCEKENDKLKKENKELKKQVDEMINIFNDSGLDYHISDELEEILND